MKSERPWLWHLLALALLFLPFLPVWWRQEILLSNDSANFEIPMLAYWKSMLLSGHWPEWYPFSNLGMPLTGATLGRLLYLPQLWFGLANPETGLLGYYLVHSVLAYFCAYHYLRSQQLDGTAARLGAVVYAGSSARVHLVGNVVFYPILTFAPAILGRLEQLCRKPGPRPAVQLALLLALVGHGGGWQLTMIFGFNFALWFLFRLRSWKPVAWAVLAGGVALLLTAPTWLPLREQSQQEVVRSVPFRAEALESSTLLPDLHLGTIYSPFYGSQAQRHQSTQRNVHEYVAVPGIALSCLWLCGLMPLAGRRNWVRGWVALLGIDGVLALGVSSPIGLWLFHHFPLFANFRVSVRFLAPFPILLMGLVAFGWERLGSSRRPWLAAPATLYYLLFLVWGRSDWLASHILLLGSLALCWLLASLPVWRGRLVWLACLLQVSAPVLFVHDSIFARPEMAEAEKRMLAEASRALRPGETVYYSLNPERTVLVGARNVAGFSPLALRRVVDFLFWMQHGRAAEAQEWQRMMFMNFHPSELAAGAKPSWPLNPMSRMLGIRFLITERGVEELPAPLPGFWLSRQAKTGRRAFDAPDFDPQAEVWFDHEPEAVAQFHEGKPSIRKWTPAEIQLEMGGASGWLTVSLPDYPGWSAQGDGKDLPIHRSYGLLSSVAVAPGTGVVTFRYRCQPFWSGLGLAGVGLLLCFGGWLIKPAAARNSEQKASEQSQAGEG
ncbi:hypothetical protein ABS71_15640 [bacterium SCN 62-11]|nr:YfhO family protein [Candidatus Eremiobacteraeota bacterium]ODT62482.1 MAG: hypothetical protein ABS71_15640 [bacterium SCN 62-11]